MCVNQISFICLNTGKWVVIEKQLWMILSFSVLDELPQHWTENLVLQSCSSSPTWMSCTETHHDHQSKCHRMLYPLDGPSWSFSRLSKILNSSETNKDRHCWLSDQVENLRGLFGLSLCSLALLKVADHEALIFWNWTIEGFWVNDVLCLSGRYREVTAKCGPMTDSCSRSEDYTSLAQLAVCRYNLHLQL